MMPEVVPAQQPGGRQGVIPQTGQVFKLRLQAGVLPDLGAPALHRGVSRRGQVVMPQQRHVNVQFLAEGVGGFPPHRVDGARYGQVMMDQSVYLQRLLVVDIVVDFVRHMLYPDVGPALFPQMGGQRGEQLVMKILHHRIACRLPYPFDGAVRLRLEDPGDEGPLAPGAARRHVEHPVAAHQVHAAQVFGAHISRIQHEGGEAVKHGEIEHQPALGIRFEPIAEGMLQLDVDHILPLRPQNAGAVFYVSPVCVRPGLDPVYLAGVVGTEQLRPADVGEEGILRLGQGDIVNGQSEGNAGGKARGFQRHRAVITAGGGVRRGARRHIQPAGFAGRHVEDFFLPEIFGQYAGGFRPYRPAADMDGVLGKGDQADGVHGKGDPRGRAAHLRAHGLQCLLRCAHTDEKALTLAAGHMQIVVVPVGGGGIGEDILQRRGGKT